MYTFLYNGCPTYSHKYISTEGWWTIVSEVDLWIQITTNALIDGSYGTGICKVPEKVENIPKLLLWLKLKLQSISFYYSNKASL